MRLSSSSARATAASLASSAALSLAWRSSASLSPGSILVGDNSGELGPSSSSLPARAASRYCAKGSSRKEPCCEPDPRDAALHQALHPLRETGCVAGEAASQLRVCRDAHG